MAYTWLDATKDFLGALGPVLIAVPWFTEFEVKRRRRKVKKAPTAGSLTELRSEIAKGLTEHIDAPKYGDMIWTLLGLASICASFVIALLENVGDLFKPP